MELDPTSSTIGELKAEVKNLYENQNRLMYYVKESTIRIEAALTKHADTDERNLQLLNDRLNDLDKFKVRVYTLAGVCSILLTAGINIVLAILRKT